MFNGFSLSTIQDAKWGSTQVNEIWYGQNKIWPTSPYLRNYLTIESLYNNNDITFIKEGQMQPLTIYVSTDDGQTWTAKTSSDNGGTVLATLNQGETLLLKGTNATYGYDLNFGNKTYINSTQSCNIYGNIMSLIYGDNFVGQTTLDHTINAYAFAKLFYKCKVVSAENLMLPATTLSVGCYDSLFRECTRLTNTPELPALTLDSGCYYEMYRGCSDLFRAKELPATTLANYCYSGMYADCVYLYYPPTILPANEVDYYSYASMFRGCSAMQYAPSIRATIVNGYGCTSMFYNCSNLYTGPSISGTSILPATTLGEYCYAYMFNGCSSLVVAPQLPATILTEGCYEFLFMDCTSLSEIRCSATDISATNSTTGWVTNVYSTGTFYKDTNTTWPSGSSGIPSGWTIINTQ